MLFGDKFSKIESWGKKNKVDKLKKFMDNKNPKIRLAVAKALGDGKGEEPVNALILMLRDPDTAVRQAAIESIGKLGQPRAIEHLRHQMAKESDDAVIKAIEQSIKKLAEAK